MENLLSRDDGYDYGGSNDGRKLKRKYQRRGPPPPSEMRTRGVKLPSYGQGVYERRAHKLQQERDELLAKIESLAMSQGKPAAAGGGAHAQQASSFDPIYGSSSVCSFKNEERIQLDSNPVYWSVQQVVDFIKTTDSAQFARILHEQEIDGQAFMLLSLPTVQEYLEYRLGPAVKLCHHIERLNLAFFEQFT